MNQTLIAILIVNGGQNPKHGNWLQIGIEQIIRHTKRNDFHIYIWNNNVADPFVNELADRYRTVTVIQADPQEKFVHLHAEPLQRLYEKVRAEGANYIVAMDSDAFPIIDGWLTTLVNGLNDSVKISGVWRDEMAPVIQSYIHASCLCTTVHFIEGHGFRFDDIVQKPDQTVDTLSNFTHNLDESESVLPLCRTNMNNVHEIISGIYGDMIYHHGAGSRRDALFHNSPRKDIINRRNKTIREKSSELVFKFTDEYINWLRDGQVRMNDFSQNHGAQSLKFNYKIPKEYNKSLIYKNRNFIVEGSFDGLLLKFLDYLSEDEENDKIIGVVKDRFLSHRFLKFKRMIVKLLKLVHLKKQ